MAFDAYAGKWHPSLLSISHGSGRITRFQLNCKEEKKGIRGLQSVLAILLQLLHRGEVRV